MTTTKSSTISKLKNNGERITILRLTMLKIFTHYHKPLTPQELFKKIILKGLQINKTSIYRQLEKMERLKIIQSVQFSDRAKRYELLKAGEHHHHLVCTTCDSVQDVKIATDLKKQEHDILNKNNFKVLHHSLEFFGICKNCQ